MKKRKLNKPTIGQKLWLSLYQAEGYERESEQIAVPANAARTNPQRATRAWLEGMSRHIKTRFTVGFKLARQKLEVTQEAIAETAGFSTNAVAMIERGERVPNLDTAARLCWALDIASGVTAEEIAV